MSGKATFYEDGGRGDGYKVIRSSEHPSWQDLGKLIPTVQPLKGPIEDALEALGVSTKPGKDGARSQYQRALDALTVVASAGANLRTDELLRVPTQDILATLDEIIRLGGFAENGHKLRDILTNRKIDAYTFTLLEAATFFHDKSDVTRADLRPRTDPGELHRLGLVEVAKLARHKVPRTKGGRRPPAIDERGIVLTIVDAFLQAAPGQVGKLASNKVLCYQLFDAVLRSYSHFDPGGKNGLYEGVIGSIARKRRKRPEPRGRATNT